MSHVLIYGDTVRSAELRHEVPVEIGDPFLYAEVDGRRVAIVWSIEGDRIAKLDPTIEIVPAETFPSDDLVDAGVDVYDIEPELVVQKARSLGLRSALVPERFPLRVADALRADGVELTVDQRLFDDRRRAKTSLELDGIRRASSAADAGLAAIAGLLARSRPGAEGREVDGQALTCEVLKEAAVGAFAAHGCRGDDLVVAHGPQAANGHDPGSGRVVNDDHLVCDLFPRHVESGCYSDTTRTFAVGTPPEEIVTWHGECVEALELARSLVRPGAHGTEVFGRVCDFFEGLGYPTTRSKPKGSVLREGFSHALGHGVGLEVHEAPFLGKYGHELVVGDVIAVEPGLYRHGLGGVRVEDLLLVTPGGCETLTRHPLGLDPQTLVETVG
jgi:Xaa-Pro aminopeptidase